MITLYWHSVTYSYYTQLNSNWWNIHIFAYLKPYISISTYKMCRLWNKALPTRDRISVCMTQKGNSTLNTHKQTLNYHPSPATGSQVHNEFLVLLWVKSLDNNWAPAKLLMVLHMLQYLSSVGLCSISYSMVANVRKCIECGNSYSKTTLQKIIHSAQVSYQLKKAILLGTAF